MCMSSTEFAQTRSRGQKRLLKYLASAVMLFSPLAARLRRITSAPDCTGALSILSRGHSRATLAFNNITARDQKVSTIVTALQIVEAVS
jgi:hypothetical protein